MSDLHELERAATVLATAREKFEAAVIAASKAHSSRKVAEAAGMSHEGVRRIVKAAQDSEVALRARLEVLDARWSKLVDKLAPAFEPPNLQREQLRRNTQNGLLARAESGKRKDGKLSGVGGVRRGRRLPTVRDECRNLAEAELLRTLTNHSEDESVRLVIAELEEARKIRVRLEQIVESRCGF